jgi:hypothetical protein
MVIISDIDMEPSKPSSSKASASAEKSRPKSVGAATLQDLKPTVSSSSAVGDALLPLQLRSCVGISVYDKKNPNEFPTCYGLRFTRTVSAANQFALSRPDVAKGVARNGKHPESVVSFGKTLSMLDSQGNLSFQSVGYVLMWNKVDAKSRQQPQQLKKDVPVDAMVTDLEEKLREKPNLRSPNSTTAFPKEFAKPAAAKLEESKAYGEIADANIAAMNRVLGKMSNVASKTWNTIQTPEFYERTSKRFSIVSNKISDSLNRTYEEYFAESSRDNLDEARRRK